MEKYVKENFPEECAENFSVCQCEYSSAYEEGEYDFYCQVYALGLDEEDLLIEGTDHSVILADSPHDWGLHTILKSTVTVRETKDSLIITPQEGLVVIIPFHNTTLVFSSPDRKFENKEICRVQEYMMKNSTEVVVSATDGDFFIIQDRVPN